MSVSLGSRLRIVREYLSLTGKDFGSALGLAANHVSMLENGERGLKLEVIQKIHETYHIDPRWFFGMVERIEDADLSRQPEHGVSTTEALMRHVTDLTAQISELRKTVKPVRELDPVAYRVTVNEPLRNIVKQIYTLEGSTLDRIGALITGYLARESEVSEKETLVS